MWIPQTNQCHPIGQHNAPIKTIAWIDDLGAIMSGSWDKSLKFWDGRTANCIHTTPLSDRVYCMDVRQNLCVVATADRQIVIYDLKKPTVEFKVILRLLKSSNLIKSFF